MKGRYLVGGAVRDELINNIHGESREINDKDYVVVGYTPEEMIKLGFTQVGADFPVFLSPIHGDEYALARTERKSASGHKGFDCEWYGVSLLEDLFRRDLTINSIAFEPVTKVLTDPCCGVSDIKHKILRHSSNAFTDDPLRVLRLARFKAQLGEGWTIAPETINLCQGMVVEGSLEELTPERVWKETEKALKSGNLWEYIEALDLFFWLDTFIPELPQMYDIVENKSHHPEKNLTCHIKLVVRQAEDNKATPPQVFACLMHDLAKPICYSEYGVAHGHDEKGAELIEQWCAKWKVPNTYRDLAMLVAKYHGKIHGSLGRGNNKGMTPKSVMKLFEATGAEKKPERFKQILECCKYDARGRGGDKPTQPYPQEEYLHECLLSVISLDSSVISAKMIAEGKEGVKIGQAIRSAKINKIREVYKSWN